MRIDVKEEPLMSFWEQMYRSIVDAHLKTHPRKDFFQLLLWGKLDQIFHCTLLHFDPATKTQTFYDAQDVYSGTMNTNKVLFTAQPGWTAIVVGNDPQTTIRCMQRFRESSTKEDWSYHGRAFPSVFSS